jgi:ribosomal protein S13
LKGGKFFNNKQIFFNFKLNDFLDNKIDGFKKNNVNFFEQRLEISTKFSINSYKNSKWLILNYLLDSIVPNNKNLKKKRLMNIYFLDFISSYRGYRHSFGLPVHGQRTWTNSNTVFKSNTLLRSYKLNNFKKSLMSLPINEVNNAFYLEQLNFLWRSQWELEWFFAKKKRLIDLKKSRGYIKFDVNTLAKINPNLKDKKKQNLFSIGFDPGFTKFILKNNLKLKLKK